MRIKRVCITALVGLNVLLAVLLLATAFQPPTATAQRARGGRGSGQFLAVTAEYTEGTDALYMLDPGTGELVVLVPDRNGSGRIIVADKRDTSQDF